MLVCCGVEDVVGLVAAEDVLHECLVGDACHDGVAEDVGILGGHDAADVVHGCLGLVDEYHFLGVEACHLVDHLAADAACGAGDEDAVCLEQPSDGLHVHFYLLAWQQVFDVHFMEQAGAQLALSVPLLFGVGHHHDFDAGRDECVDDGVLFAEVCCLQGADYQGGCSFLPHECHEVVAVGPDGFSHHPVSLHVLVGADEAAYAVACRHLVAYALCQADAAALGAVDEDAPRHFAGAEEVVHGLDHDADGAHGGGCHDDEDEHQSGAAQEHLVILGQEDVADVGDGGAEGHGVEDAGEVDEAAEAEDAAVGVEDAEGNGVGDEQDQQLQQDAPEVAYYG